MTSTQKLLMIGASVRAAAHSARHYQLRTCDLFADYDLQQVADASMLPAEKFPKGFADWARKQKDTTEWMYTGGLENYPDIIQEIADRHPLLGSNSVSVRSVRDPFQFMKFVEWMGIPGVLATSVVRCDEHLPGRHVLKPFRSCGGLGIQFGHLQASQRQDRAYYRQQFIEGQSLAGLYISNGQSCCLLGVTQSWTESEVALASTIGDKCTANSFRYGGSIGPISNIDSEIWWRLGQATTEKFRLRGLFGIDCIQDDRGDLMPLEVNPRFTASMELLPEIEGRTAVEWHVAACRWGEIPCHNFCTGGTNLTLHAKGILYAPNRLNVTNKIRERAILAANDAKLADLPVDGCLIQSGQPMLTVKISGDSANTMRRQLSWLPGELFHSIWQAASACPRLG